MILIHHINIHVYTVYNNKYVYISYRVHDRAKHNLSEAIQLRVNQRLDPGGAVEEHRVAGIPTTTTK